MAYSSKKFSVLAYANGFTLWHYATPDAVGAVAHAGYFNAAAEMIRAGDFIIVNAGEGTDPQNGVFVAASNKNGQVALSAMMPVTA